MADDNQSINTDDTNRALRELTELLRIQINLQGQQNTATKGASVALNTFDSKLEESARNWLAMTKEQREAYVRQKEAQARGTSALQSLGDAGMAAGRAMLEGKKGAAAMNDSLGHVTQAATLLGTALMLLIPGGPIIKGLIAGFTAITAGVTKYAQAANEMADKLYTGYAGMAKAGGAAADGMTGLFEDTKKLGLSMNELGDFVNVVAKNAPELAMFGGTVFEGRKRLAAMGKELENNREQFINMGLSMQDVTEGMASYISLQTRVGQTQNKTTAELAAGAKRYLEEQDLLTKITGMSRQEQEAVREAALSEQRFAGKLEELRLQGRDKEAEELMKVNIMLTKQSKEAAQAFRDISTNNVQTEAAQKGLRSSQGEMMRTAQLVSAGQIEAAQATGNIVQAVGRTTKALGPTMAMMGTHEDSLLNYSDSLKMAGQKNRDYVKESEEAAAQIKRQKEGADPLIKQQGELRNTQINANEAMERFVKAGIGPAQDAMIMLAKATAAGTESLNSLFGIESEKSKQAKKAEADKFAKERGKAVEEAGIGGASTFDGFEQRAGGSLDAVGKLIEDFGRGTPTVLHGREGVITEDQLRKFGTAAMNMGRDSAPQQIDPRSMMQAMQQKITIPDTAIDRAKTAPAKETTRPDTAIDRAKTAPAKETTRPDMALDIKSMMQAMQQKIAVPNMAIDRINAVPAVENTAEDLPRADMNERLMQWVDSAFSDLKLDVTPLRQSLQVAAEEVTRAPVKEINEQVDRLMQDTKDLVQWQQQYSTTEKQTQENILELTEKIRDNTFQSRLISDRDRLNLDNFADRRRQLYDNIVQNLDQQFKVTRMPTGAGAAATQPGAPAGAAAAPSDAAVQAGIGGTMPEVKGMPTGGGAPPDVDAKDYVKFTGGTGSEQHFEKLADNVESAFLQMARDYNQLTGGKTLQVNSAFRSPQEQANVDSGSNPKAAPGMSLHNVGRALDIQSAQRNELDQLGLLKKYGFRPLQGDPPHISMRDGGIAHGPESGYPAELHGTEAVIPLGDGALTMDLPAMESLLEVTTDMGEQIVALKDDMRSMLNSLNETMRDNSSAGAQARMIEILENISRAQNQTADASRRMAQAAAN